MSVLWSICQALSVLYLVYVLFWILWKETLNPARMDIIRHQNSRRAYRQARIEWADRMIAKYDREQDCKLLGTPSDQGSEK